MPVVASARSTTAAADQARAGSCVTINTRVTRVLPKTRDRERSWFTRRFSADSGGGGRITLDEGADRIAAEKPAGALKRDSTRARCTSGRVERYGFSVGHQQRRKAEMDHERRVEEGGRDGRGTRGVERVCEELAACPSRYSGLNLCRSCPRRVPRLSSRIEERDSEGRSKPPE